MPALRLSVAMCTCNGQAFLRQQLDSLARQQQLPDELIICDDASTDQTPDIIRAFIADAPFAVQFEINPRRMGTRQNFELALGKCTGDLLLPCDQDDIWYPDKLARIASAAASDPAPALIFSDADLIDDRSQPLGSRMWESIGFAPSQKNELSDKGLFAVLVRFNVVTGAAMAFSRKWRDMVLPVPDGWVHDAWISMVLANLAHCVAIEEPLLAYRQHGLQQIGAGPPKIAQRMAIAKRMDRSYFLRLAENFCQLEARLQRHAPLAANRFIVREKVAHCRARAEMRRSPWARFPAIGHEWMTGRYRRCSLGWQSTAQDLFLI